MTSGLDKKNFDLSSFAIHFVSKLVFNRSFRSLRIRIISIIKVKIEMEHVFFERSPEVQVFNPSQRSSILGKGRSTVTHFAKVTGAQTKTASLEALGQKVCSF